VLSSSGELNSYYTSWEAFCSRCEVGSRLDLQV